MEIVKGNKYICENCGKEFIYEMKYPSRIYGISLCRNCIREKRKEKINETIVNKYGSYENYEKTRQETLLKSAIEKHGNKENFYKFRAEKAKDSILNKYDSWELYQKEKGEKIAKSYSEMSKEKKDLSNEKRKETFLRKYGSESVMQSEELKEKWKNARDKKIEEVGGKEKYYKEVSKKRNKTMIEKYGAKVSPKHIESARNLCSSKEFIEQRKETCLRKYGKEVYFPSGRKQYLLNGQKFDSSWELAYYIWLCDNNIDFILKPAGIKYFTDDGKQHYYYPDFFTDHLIEIKGDHLIKDGVLLDYHGNPLKEKTQCLKENNVEILTWKDIEEIYNYILEKYGDNYFESLKA